jgi:hypothetical protein
MGLEPDIPTHRPRDGLVAPDRSLTVAVLNPAANAAGLMTRYNL